LQDIEEKKTSLSNDVDSLLILDSIPESDTDNRSIPLIGTGDIARTIIDTADERGIRIREHPALSNLLLRIDKDEAVTKDIRNVMDTMLKWVMKISDSKK
jgi:type III secretion system FlhB-like substrate exporter